MADSMYCEHDRTAEACEECAYGAAKSAGHPVPDKLYPPSTVVDADAEPTKATTTGKRRK